MYTKTNKILNLFISGIFIVILFFPILTFGATSTPDPGNDIIKTLRIFGANMGLPNTDPRAIVAQLIRTAMGFLGIIAVIMILISGAKLMISGGEKEKVRQAKSTFFNALIGLFIILSAYSIVAFVLNTLSEVTK